MYFVLILFSLKSSRKGVVLTCDDSKGLLPMFKAYKGEHMIPVLLVNSDIELNLLSSNQSQSSNLFSRFYLNCNNLVETFLCYSH